MNALKIFGVIVALLLAGFFCVGVGGCSYAFGVVNKEVGLRVAVQAKEKSNENGFDAMWKIISQNAQITDKYKNDFKDIWPDLIAGRYKSGGELMKWVQERNPDFDSSLYKSLMATVESERKQFARRQDELIDLNRERTSLVNSYPAHWVLAVFGNVQPLEIRVVTSTKTGAAFESGTDDDTTLFPQIVPVPKAEKGT